MASMKNKRVWLYRAVSVLVLFAQPQALEAANIFVAENGSYDLSSINPDGSYSTIASVPAASGLAFDQSGVLHAGSQFGGGIRKFTQAGAPLGVISNSVMDNVMALAIDQSNDIYVGQDGSISATLLKMSPSGATLWSKVLPSAVFGIATDNSNNVYASTNSNVFGPGVIHRWGSDGTDLGVFVDRPGSFFRGLAFDDVGNMYAADAPVGSNLVRKFSPTGVELAAIPLNGNESPWALAYSAVEGLFVSGIAGNNVGNPAHVFKYSSITSQFEPFALGLTGPVGLAIPPVPEPSTFVLAALGCGIALVARRRD